MQIDQLFEKLPHHNDLLDSNATNPKPLVILQNTFKNRNVFSSFNIVCYFKQLL